MVAIYLGPQLGRHRQVKIGKMVGLEETSSLRSAYLRLERRVTETRKPPSAFGYLKTLFLK